MWPSIVLGFRAGVVFGNGVPHFVKGITKDRYPCLFGGGPVPNFIAGWLSFVVAVVGVNGPTWTSARPEVTSQLSWPTAPVATKPVRAIQLRRVQSRG